MNAFAVGWLKVVINDEKWMMMMIRRFVFREKKRDIQYKCISDLLVVVHFLRQIRISSSSPRMKFFFIGLTRGVGSIAPTQLERRELAPSGAEVAKHYLVLFGLMRPAVDLRVFIRRQTAAKRGQRQLGAADAASETLRVILLPGDRFEFLQRVNRLCAPEAERDRRRRGRRYVRSLILIVRRFGTFRQEDVFFGGRDRLNEDPLRGQQDVVVVLPSR